MTDERGKFYVTQEGRRWVVRYPNGSVRCSIWDDPVFALTVCRELNAEIGGDTENHHGKTRATSRKCKKVRCIDTGEVFASQRIASQKTGVCQTLISHDCLGKTKHTAKPRMRFEFVRETA